MCFVAHSSYDKSQTLSKVQNCLNWPDWEKAIQTEIDQLHNLSTYTLQDLLPDCKAIGCQWIFVIKWDANEDITKYKACLVAQGFSQILGQDFSATYAPVIWLKSFQTLLALAAVLDLNIHQMDVIGAYLNSNLEKSIFIKQPPGFKDRTSHICHLHKAIYGLKQAGHTWNLKFNVIFINQLCYTRIHPDSCVYIKSFLNSTFCVIIIHVNNMAILALSTNLIDQVKGKIHSLLNTTDLGKIKTFVGLKITCD